MSNLLNKETGFKIATIPEELPPLRKGYFRVVHQTCSIHAESLAEKGLVYNKKYAGMGKNPYDKNYMDAGYMSVQYSEEGFWDRLTDDGTRHMNSDVIAIFDMPAEEYTAHLNPDLACYLNGTISRGYMVGIIPNYGTKDLQTEQRLSVSEMEEKKRIAKSNPLPPLYETPNWRENIEKAWKTFFSKQTEIDDIFLRNHQNDDGESNTYSGTNDAEWDWVDFGSETEANNNTGESSFDDWSDFNDNNETDTSVFSPEPEYIYNEVTGEFNYKNPEFQQKAEQRRKQKLENQDYLQYKLERIKKKLGYKKLDEDIGKTGDSCSGEVSETHRQVSQIQTETAKTSPARFKEIIRNR
ncbi:MAG: hypothetical protein E7004_06030 [Alphaproteobacteria bacterium]|nr:hypothetical protein [Alphaproteobacteria bacterium]